MLLIGEVSKISQVSLQMLRYYDKNDIFKPKVIHEETGYRYYTADQLDDLYKIVELRDLGFSIAEIKELLQDNRTDAILEAIDRKKEELEVLLADTTSRLRRLDGLRQDVVKENRVSQNIAIVLKKIPDMKVVSYRKTVENYFCEGEMWAEFGTSLRQAKIPFQQESFSLYHDMDYREEQVDIELCTVVEEQKEQLPEGLTYRTVPGCEHAVSIIVKGPYENISPAYRMFAHWLEQHEEYKMHGPTRQICYVSPINTRNPEEFVTELLIPLEMM